MQAVISVPSGQENSAAGRWKRGLAGAMGSLTTLWAWVAHATPETVRQLVIACLIFMAADLLTALVGAALAGKVSSAQMRKGLVAKSAQYAGLLCLGTGAAVLAQTWLPVQAGLGAIVAIEGVSIVENMKRIQTLGGVNLGPANGFLNWVGRFFEAQTAQTDAKLPAATEAHPPLPTPPKQTEHPE